MSAPTLALQRRDLLKLAGLVGASALAPAALLSACGGGSDETSGGGERESHDLHFDLSQAPIFSPRLQLPNSQSHGARLRLHDTASRTRARRTYAALAEVPDDNLTHYAEGVDLPASALQLVGVWGTNSAGAPVLAGNFLHVPTAARAAVSARRVAAGQSAAVLMGTLRAFGVPPQTIDGQPIKSPISVFATPRDVATWLVFQHPAITNLQPDLGADIIDRIQHAPCDAGNSQCYSFVDSLAQQVALLLADGGYPTTRDTGSWATLVAVVDTDTGEPQYDTNGHPLYNYELNPALQATAAGVVKAIVKSISNDPLFEGSNWQSPDGGPSTVPLQTIGQAVTAGVSAVQSSIALNKRISGIRLFKLSATDDRTVKLTVKNEFIRTVGAFVEYQDANGKRLPVANPGPSDTDRAKYVTLIPPDSQIMGVPFLGDQTPVAAVQFTMPPEASKAVVYFGSLGIGGADAYHGEALMGSIFTAVLNLTIPTICLVYGINTTLEKGLDAAINKILADPIVTKTIITLVVAQVGSGALSRNTQSAIGGMSCLPFVAGAAGIILQILLKCCPRLSLLLAEAIAGSQVADAIPFVGVALWALSTAADLATIAETEIECLASPPIDKTVLSLSMDSTVRISRDPNNYQFPATASRFHIEAIYDGGATPRTCDGSVTAGQIDPIDAVLRGVPSGGKVEVNVSFYSASDALVGHGSSGSIVNLPGSAALIPITITETLVELDSATSYRHRSKLVYANGARAWSSSAPAPTATRANLCQGNDAAICALGDLTVHTSSGMAGYGFNAGGQGVGLCGGGPAASLYTVENVFLGNAPDSGLKFSSCGSTQPMGIAYSPAGPIAGGKNFFLQPGADGYYHLRGVTLDSSTNFDMRQTLSWGRFFSPVESLCVTASGFAVGVNRNTHKIEVLALPDQARPPTFEPDSAPFAALRGGQGNRVGLLDTPVAVAAFGGALLVLEQGNRRVQAFDPDGSTVALFTDGDGQPTPIMPLAPDDNIVYLDLAVEGRGYMYVLSYIGSGNQPGNYRVDLYSPKGAFLSRTTGVAAGAIAVDLFLNLYSLNYEPVHGSPRTEPSLSQWLPQHP